MQPSSRDLLFGQGNPGLPDDLNNLATVMQSARDSAGMKGFSNTGAVLAVMGALSGVTQGVISGSPKAVLGSAALPFMGVPTGQLLTSRPFVRWLSGTYAVNPAAAGQWGAHLGRLGAVAQADPSIAGYIQQMRNQLPDQPPRD